MFKSNIKKQELLEETQKTLKKSQELLESINSSIISKSTFEEKVYTEDEKRLAAYVLNICTVSVSQIIDFDDIRFLEKEYDNILNNLNLQNMPKDEELLNIFKRLLDTISFFMIQDEEKKFLDKQYQQKIKNAIWSAVPSPTILLGATNPAALAITVASAVGTGYMNFRKEKANINADKEKDRWRMQKSAMEQFHGLRRELFDTAWRLADKYDFNDELRITERQIKNFNSMLLDSNEKRKYERLLTIEEQFSGYPLFYYYLGEAAHEAGLSVSAVKSFQKYVDNIEKYDIFREDQITASCYLELAEIANASSKDKACLYIDKAVKKAGNSYDILQLAALDYYGIMEHEKAGNLFYRLINEEYCVGMNANFLSRIYILQYNSVDKSNRDTYKEKYISLSEKISDDEVLFPFPDESDSDETEYIKRCKIKLLNDCCDCICKYYNKCKKELSDLISVKDDISKQYIDLLKSILLSVSTSFGLNKENIIPANFQNEKDIIQKLLSYEGVKSRKDSDGVILSNLIDEMFISTSKQIKSRIEKTTDISVILEFDASVFEFVNRENLPQKNIYTTNNSNNQENDFGKFIEQLAEKSEENVKLEKLIEKAINTVKKYKDSIIISTEKKADVALIIRDENTQEFNRYFNSHRDLIKNQIRDKTFAVLNDGSFSDKDLIFTTENIRRDSRNFLVSNRELDYFAETTDHHNSKARIGNSNKFINYSDKYVDAVKLCEMITALKDVLKESIEIAKNETEGKIKTIFIIGDE